MDPISNADRLVRLLRQRLEERGKAKTGKSVATASSVQQRGIEATKAIAGRFARDGGSDAALRRTLVEQLLADQFGAGLINDTKFQQLVDKVATAMEADPGVAELLEQVIAELKR
jgi:hypothetical protein